MVPIELLSCSAPSAAAPPLATPPSAPAHDRDHEVPCAACPLLQQLRDAQWQAAYYKAQHQRACQREQQ